jgi:hypothetical protein
VPSAILHVMEIKRSTGGPQSQGVSAETVDTTRTNPKTEQSIKSGVSAANDFFETRKADSLQSLLSNPVTIDKGLPYQQQLAEAKKEISNHLFGLPDSSATQNKFPALEKLFGTPAQKTPEEAAKAAAEAIGNAAAISASASIPTRGPVIAAILSIIASVLSLIGQMEEKAKEGEVAQKENQLGRKESTLGQSETPPNSQDPERQSLKPGYEDRLKVLLTWLAEHTPTPHNPPPPHG